MEVLKAIQKAKEVKDRMSSCDKKVRSVTLNPAGCSARPAETSLYDQISIYVRYLDIQSAL